MALSKSAEPICIDSPSSTVAAPSTVFHKPAAIQSTCKITFVTFVTAAQFPMLENLIGSLHLNQPGCELIVFPGASFEEV
jgi:hypothetical protein